MPPFSIISGLIGAGGANAAGGAADAAGDNAYKNAQTERARNWANISPWYGVGSEAVNKLAQLYGLGHLDGGANDKTFGGQRLLTNDVAGDRTNALRDFQASPGYQWRLGEGVKALDRSAASKGMVLSGPQARGVTEFGQNLGSDEFGKYTNALMGLSGAGETGALGTNATNAGITNAGNALSFQGDMGRASSYSNAANALASGIMNGVNNFASLAGYTGFGKNAFASV